MNQLALFTEPQRLARRRDPVTSHKAAENTPAFRAKHEATIYAALSCGRGLTYREIAAATGMEPVAVGRRLKGMESRGLIRRDGEREGMTVWWRA